MGDKYTMSESDHSFADGIEEMIAKKNTLHSVMLSVEEGAGQLAAAMVNRKLDVEWIINDQSTRRMYGLVLKAVERMKEIAKDEGLESWDGKITDNMIAAIQDTPHATFTAKCLIHDCNLRIDEKGPYCSRCREEVKENGTVAE